MRKRKFRLLGESIIDLLRWRFIDPPVDGLGGGPSGAPAPEADIPPVNGGPDRDFDSLSNGTIDLPPDATGGAVVPVQPRTPQDPNQRAGATPAGTPAAQQWQSIREAAAAQGYRFDATVVDDRTALNFLLAQANRNQQADHYAALGRQLAPRQQEIQQFLAGQQRQGQSPSAPSAPAQRQAWEAPEFDERWMAGVKQDPVSGMYVAQPGFPEAIATKVNEFAQWKANYDRNPAAVLNGMVEARAKAISTDTFREQFAAQQRETQIASIVQENSSWLYQLDAGGQRAVDYAGRFIPTPVGSAYMAQLQSVQAMGITDPVKANELAKQLVRGQYAQAYQAQQLGVQQQAANPGTIAAQNAPNRNPLQAQPPSTRRANAPAVADPSESGLSLSERLMRDLLAEGVTSNDIAASAGVD